MPKPLSPVQRLERLGLEVFLEPGNLKLQVRFLDLLPEDYRLKAQTFIAAQHHEMVRILKPYHSGQGLRLDGGPWKGPTLFRFVQDEKGTWKALEKAS